MSYGLRRFDDFMKILLVNKFLYPKGGDAIVTLNTGKLLAENGHDVQYWGMAHQTNGDFRFKDFFVRQVDFEKKALIKEQLTRSSNLLYSFEAKNKIEKVLKIWKPDIVHLHNYAHQISPSILHVFKKYNIPVVMTMHDYKLVCPVYSLLSNGKVCEECKEGKYYRCIVNKCTKSSYSKSILNSIEMYLHHKILHIYNLIDIFISPSQFLKEKVEEMGFKRKIIHLPNFINIKEYMPKYDWEENSIVYFGRLSKEKGLFTLIEAMKELSDITLKIIGEGTIRESLELEVRSSELKNVKFLGYKSGEELKEEIRKSMFVVLPSECYENNPKSIIEAFAVGKPAIGAKIGGIPELIKEGLTGFTFDPGKSTDLQSKVENLLSNPGQIIQMGKNARKFLEEELASEKHYQKLLEVYLKAIER